MGGFGWLIALVVVGVAGMFGHSLRVHRKWDSAANDLGLTGHARELHLDGIYDECAVVAEAQTGKGPRITVRPRFALPADLGFGREGLLQGMLRTVNGADVQTGDPRFDDAVLVTGDPARVLAVLDPANRAAIRKLVDNGAVLDGGELRSTDDAAAAGGKALVDAIKGLTRIAHKLRLNPAEVPDRLLQRVRRDPLPGVRARALDLLLARHPEAEETARALERALKDRNADLRMTAARHAGDRARDALVSLMHDDAAAVERRIEAMDLLAERFGTPNLAPELARALDDARMVPAAAARGARFGCRALVPTMRTRLADADDAAAIALVAAIGQLGDPRDETVEDDLLPLLDRPALRPAVCTALARLGTPRALPALLPLTEGVLAGAKDEARAAIEAIRARRGDRPAGGLSLASAGEIGALAVSDEEDERPDGLDRARAAAGRLSVRPGPAETEEES